MSGKILIQDDGKKTVNTSAQSKLGRPDDIVGSEGWIIVAQSLLPAFQLGVALRHGLRIKEECDVQASKTRSR